MDHVYHYTDSGRLPWILADRALRPFAGRFGDFPGPALVWATRDQNGDSAASCNTGTALQRYRQGELLRVRITAKAEAFDEWARIGTRFPEWTAEETARFEQAAQAGEDARNWVFREEALPRAEWVAIEVRSYSNNNWRQLPDDVAPLSVRQPNGLWMGVVIGDMAYLSCRVRDRGGRLGYKLGRIPAASLQRRQTASS